MQASELHELQALEEELRILRRSTTQGYMLAVQVFDKILAPIEKFLSTYTAQYFFLSDSRINLSDVKSARAIINTFKEIIQEGEF